MIIDTIKISQEINFNGMPTWVSVGGTLLPEDNVLDGLRQLQKSITDYQTEEAKAYQQSKWAKNTDQTYSNAPIKSMIEEMESCTTYADIQSFRFTIKNADEQDVYERKLSELIIKI